MRTQITIVFLLTATFLAGTVLADNKDDIIFVVGMVRHGARNMANKAYMGIVDDKSFLRDPGRLTDIGKHQLYLYGRQLADTYTKVNQLLDTRYNSKQLVVRSSGINRTIESAQSLLSGLYQPGTGASLNEQQMENAAPPIKVANLDDMRTELRDAALPYYMRTVPVHTSTAVNDYLFAPHVVCDAIAEDEKDYQDVVDQINKKYTGLYDLLKSKYKLDVRSSDDCYMLYDNIVAAQANAVNLNVNFEKEDLDLLKKASLENSLVAFPRSDLKVKLMSHVLLWDTRRHFAQAIKDAETRVPEKERLRMALFEISDAHLLALNRLLPLKLDNQVEFASSLIFELHRAVDTLGNPAYSVKAMYNAKPVDLGKLSKYEAFKEFLDQNVYADEKEYLSNCFLDTTEQMDRETFTAVTIILMITLVIVWGTNWYLLVHPDEDLAKTSEEEPEAVLINATINEGAMAATGDKKPELAEEKKTNAQPL